MNRKPRQTRNRMMALAAAALMIPVLAGSVYADDHRGRNDRKDDRRQVDRHDRRDHNDRNDRRDWDRDRGGRGDFRGRDHDKNKGSVFFRIGSPVTRVVVADTCEATNHSSGYYRQEWCPPVYETRYDHCGRPFTVMTAAGHYRQVWVSTPPPVVVHTTRPSGIVIGGTFRF